MQVILDEKEYNYVWDKIFSVYKFAPLYRDWSEREWIVLPGETKKYSLKGPWTSDQEKLVNQCFKQINTSDMYALDWHHDCFLFNPNEDIPYEYWYHNEERNCNVYFPSYYPDGDYHFFITKDWRLGLFGHPWKQEIYVMGRELIEKFDMLKEDLDLL